jgi:outer membrane lipoprotein-sorting protein
LKAKIALFCLINLAPLAQARPDIVEQQKKVEREYKKMFRSIEHMTVDFDQIIYKSLRKRKISRKGIAYFSKPSMFRWDFSDKGQGIEEFYFDGNQLTHFREGEKLVTHYKAGTGIASELSEVVDLVLDPVKLFNRYQVEKITKTKEQDAEVRLVPRAALSSDIEAIFVTVAGGKGHVKATKILYMNENYTEFLFSNPRFTTNPLQLFIFSRKGPFTVRTHG